MSFAPDTCKGGHDGNHFRLPTFQGIRPGRLAHDDQGPLP